MVQMVRLSTSRSYFNIVESVFSGVTPPTSRTATHGGGRTGAYLKFVPASCLQLSAMSTRPLHFLQQTGRKPSVVFKSCQSFV